ncbi:MAG: hypothetical protein JW870_16445 [Candidatus Delongbacteria bacterium]|nr:hypothetical protein [Candidatus Delongbacteria bacterium]
MEVIKVYFDENFNLIFQFSIWFFLSIVLLIIIYFLLIKKVFRYSLVKIDIKLGNVGTAEFRPNKTDLQIAHKIWTQLITRKAAIPIDKENDVIEEIYDSWYALFQKVRDFISEIPADLIRNNNSTREIVRIATQTLNVGLRPHLTKWQARFRTWSSSKKDKLMEMTPQDFQKEYPEYKYLIEDLMLVNEQLIQYAQELKKIIDKK